MSDAGIRPARREDAEAIADIHLDALRRAMPWLPVLHSRAEATDYFSNDVLAREQVMVAERDGAVVGFIAMEGDHVEHLYVAPEWQSKGIGDRLLSIAKEAHPGGLTLWTFQRNTRARAFYEARGFVAAQFTDGSRNEEREPDVLYEWRPDRPRGDR